jgi:hypothetical protein
VQGRRWESIDERVGEPRFGERVTVNPVDTARVFRKLRLLCINSPVIGTPGFTLDAFELHGAVFPKGRSVRG